MYVNYGSPERGGQGHAAGNTKYLRDHARPYQSCTRRAWRNAMVGTINSAARRGIIEGLIGLPVTFRLTIDGIPAFANIRPSILGAVCIDVALWPHEDLRWWWPRKCGAFVTSGWFNWDDGYLYTETRPQVFCRRGAIDIVAGLDIAPEGYSDHSPWYGQLN
jgi:hypothetical protein